MHSKLLWWLSLLGLFSALALSASAQQQAGKIQAARVIGNVSMTIKATNATTPVVNQQSISEGAIITTARGASVVLLFGNGATINLGADSALDIEQFEQNQVTTFDPKATEEPNISATKLRLNHGELVGKVAKLKTTEGSSFKIDTPVGAAGIRGTTFRIVYRPDGTGKAFFSLTTLEGNVEVTLASGTVANAPVSVTDNKEVVIADVTVDAAGNATITLPSGTTVVVPTNASTGTIQEIINSAQQIATVVATAVTNDGPTGTPPQDAAPGATTTPLRITTPDGG